MSDQTDSPKLDASDQDALASSSQKSLPPADEVALEALSQSGSGAKTASTDDTSAAVTSSATDSSDDEIADSNQLAETLSSLQRVIENSAQQLERLSKDLKEKREMLKNVFENDAELSTAQDEAQLYTNQIKERKSKLQNDPQVTSIKVQLGELNEQKKEIEESLSNHLVNYYSLTNSTSFDTSDGDQWDFSVKAKVKPRRGKKDE